MVAHGPFVARAAVHRQPAAPARAGWARFLRRCAIETDAYELFRRGSELLAGRHAHQAVIALERARDAAPEHASVREALARAYYGAGRPADAGAEFAKALEIDPTNDYAHFGIALCLERSGELDAARGHAKLAVAMRPEDENYRRVLERMMPET